MSFVVVLKNFNVSLIRPKNFLLYNFFPRLFVRTRKPKVFSVFNYLDNLCVIICLVSNSYVNSTAS